MHVSIEHMIVRKTLIRQPIHPPPEKRKANYM